MEERAEMKDGLDGPRRFMAVASKSHCQIAGELAQQIKGLLYTYSDRIPLALAVGVLQIVEKELLDEAD
jgi:hypothetical protein